MLTENATKERVWGRFPALRHLLESKPPSDRFIGLTSVSDTFMDWLHRVLSVADLARHHEEDIVAAARNDRNLVPQLLSEVRELMDALNAVRGTLDGDIRALDALGSRVAGP